MIAGSNFLNASYCSLRAVKEEENVYAQVSFLSPLLRLLLRASYVHTFHDIPKTESLLVGQKEKGQQKHLVLTGRVFLHSSAKTKTMQRKATATTHNNTDAAENVRERDAVNNNDHDDAMFNDDDDDDLDITEIDHVLQGKAPLSSPNTQESKGTNRKTTKTEQKPASQRYG